MGDRFKDFDTFWAEREKEPLGLKVLGKEYTLPPSIPAKLALRVVRLDAQVKSGERDAKEQMKPEELEEIATALFGSEIFQEWLDKGMDLEQLGEIIEWALDAYGTGVPGEGEGPEGDDELAGEVPAPERGPDSPPSSNSGISSSPTSDESIESISQAS